MTSADIAIEAIGWIGSALCLGAYLATSVGALAGTSRLYQWMNFLGGASLAVNVVWHRAYPAALLEICWALIGFVALIRIANQASDRARPNAK